MGKKVIMALAGLFWVLFLIAHLLGNLTIFAGPDALNSYAHKLEGLKALVIAAELFLALALILHALYGVIVWWEKWQARPQGYATYRSKGKPSYQSLSSRTMLYTGIIIFVFVVIHLLNFKFGRYETTTVNGQEVRDLFVLVKEVFNQPLYLIFYEVVMILIGFHLRHAFWSAFQSLGLGSHKYTPIIYKIGVALAIIIAFGFFIIPIYVFLNY